MTIENMKTKFGNYEYINFNTLHFCVNFLIVADFIRVNDGEIGKIYINDILYSTITYNTSSNDVYCLFKNYNFEDNKHYTIALDVDNIITREYYYVPNRFFIESDD